MGLNLDLAGKAKRDVGLLRRLQYFLSRSSLLTIYKSFIITHLDYGDVIYDQLSNASLSRKIESVQYYAALAITRTIRGLSRDLHHRCWMRRLCLSYKFLSTNNPNNNIITKYTHDLFFLLTHSFRHPNSFTYFVCSTEYFRNSFFGVL